MTLDKLKGIIPDIVIAQIPEVMTKYEINTPLRLAHFLSQCAHESGNFTKVYEGLMYSAEGLKKTFPKYFPGSLNESYAKKPEAIANHVYASRMGNGDEKSGEGYKFRGRGYIQLTGKNNYTNFDKLVTEDILSNPDLVATKYPLLSAAFYWNSVNLNATADKGSDNATLTSVRKKVNGGTIGLQDCIDRFNKIYNIIK